MLAYERFEGAKALWVGRADLMVSQDRSLILCSFPLGCCLGVAVYDPEISVGGLLHAVLPDSSIDSKRALERPAMFLDTGLARLLEATGDLKAKKENLLVSVAGASEVLDPSACFNIGKLNYAALGGLLGRHGIRIHAQDVGGFSNRNIQLNLATGEVRLRFSGQPSMKTLCRP